MIESEKESERERVRERESENLYGQLNSPLLLIYMTTMQSVQQKRYVLENVQLNNYLGE